MLKKHLFLLFILCGNSLILAATVDLNLKGALDRAPEANFQILLSEQGLVVQEEATRSARSGLLPQVSLQASQGRSMNPTVDAFSAALPGAKKRYFNDRFDALLRARLSLVNTRTWDDWKISKLTLQATRLQLDNTVQEVLRSIGLAYFAHWRNQRRLDVIDANLERDRLLLRIARDQQDAGVATDLDVTRAEVRLATNELARLQQETTLMDSSLRLKRILNISLDNQLNLVREAFDIELAELDYDRSGLADVLEKRPDYRRLQTELERESLALRASKRDRLPSLDLTGEWGLASESWSDSMEEQWAVGIGLSMPIFEGFRLDAQKRAAAAALRQKELELEDLTAQIEADYRLALQTMESGFRRVEVARRAVALNEREFELSRIRFEEGVADNSDVVDAQANLADAEDALVEAEYQYAQARINLAYVEGDVRAILQ
ncbi:TolC family protein [Puniceicoccales bacterium CK1056]|uniref:TolC family protein n=1 Tax=Oceanipulchritudo coccoides TaxID=2706888 RepID=A0A6B2LYP2_9BACT|nr:TolC family protein [Oceanipulchritudo coccoides]NDV60877.1 TolC family protein [Oceanipulchritudo coccoides]